MMSKGKSLGLSVVFLAIALFVSGTLVVTLRQSYAAGGTSPMITDAIHLLQKA
jgi:hypothetical protein